MGIILCVIGLLVGLVVGWLAGQGSAGRQSDALEAEKERIHQENIERQDRLSRQAAEERERLYKESTDQLERRHGEALELQERRHNEALAQQERRHAEAMEAMRRQFEETVNTMSAKLAAVTEKMLKDRQAEFVENSGERLNQILSPLQTNLKEMRETVKANTDKHSEIGGRLDAGLATLLEQTAKARTSADNLAKALRGSNQIQGEWGETVLRELLESQGLREGVHYHTQHVLQDASGKNIVNTAGNMMRPDVVVHLDRERDVIIDSKVSLSAYLEYVNAEDDITRKRALESHIRSIESHVGELVKKDYSGYRAEGKTPLGYVIMFIPNTTALLLATTHRPDLWRKAMEQKVYIADEQTLYAALKIVSLTWQQIAQAGNHEKVYALAEEMLGRVGAFMKCFTEIGLKLEAAQKSYNEGCSKLRDGGQSIPQTARKLVTLGAKYKKQPKGVAPELLGLSDSEAPELSDGE